MIAKQVGASVELIDVGIDAPTSAVTNVSSESPTTSGIKVTDGRVRRGTRDFSVEAAMTAQEAEAALAVGQDAVDRASVSGQNIVCIGEIGIGNTTCAATLLSALTGLLPPCQASKGGLLQFYAPAVPGRD